MSKPTFCFLDLETTGLDTMNDDILEVGAILTDENLEMLTVFSNVVHLDNIEWDAVRQEYVPPFGIHKTVVDMHHNNGLWHESYYSELSIDQVLDAFIEWLMFNVPADTQLYLSGNSVWFDRFFMLRHGFDFGKLFSHRQVDNSSIRVLASEWSLDMSDKPADNEIHRAMPDCLDSINTLKYYRGRFFAR